MDPLVALMGTVLVIAFIALAHQARRSLGHESHPQQKGGSRMSPLLPLGIVLGILSLAGAGWAVYVHLLIVNMDPMRRFMNGDRMNLFYFIDAGGLVGAFAGGVISVILIVLGAQRSGRKAEELPPGF